VLMITGPACRFKRLAKLPRAAKPNRLATSIAWGVRFLEPRLRRPAQARPNDARRADRFMSKSKAATEGFAPPGLTQMDTLVLPPRKYPCGVRPSRMVRRLPA